MALLDSYCGLYMANTAELYAGQFGITREMQDEFALRSQKLADDAGQGWATCRRKSRRFRCAIAKASPRAKCSRPTIICVRKPRWRAWRS